MSETTKNAVEAPEQTAEYDASLNIFQRMMKATAEIRRVAKNLKVEISKNQSYKAVAEADVLEAVKPVEEKFGIYSYPVKREIIKDEAYTTRSEYNGNSSEKTTLFMRLAVTYRFVNVDKPDEFIDITTYGDGVDTQDKAPGKAMTYADKYALLKGYKIATGDDPDAEPSGELKRKSRGDEYTPEQLKEARELGIDLNKVAAYYKCSVADITSELLAVAIERKKKQLAANQQTGKEEAK